MKRRTKPVLELGAIKERSFRFSTPPWQHLASDEMARIT